MGLCIAIYSSKTFCNSDFFPVRTIAITGSNLLFVLKKKFWPNLILYCREKKLKSVFDFLTYSRETGLLFSNEEDGELVGLIAPLDKIDWVSKYDNSLSFGAKQNTLRQIFFALWFFKDFFMKNSNLIFFNFLSFCIGSIKECI